jgi:glutamyl-tRNA synthetase
MRAFYSRNANLMTIRTRFAPSPTGYLHIGGARTALFNWLLARNQGGSFVLRVEDTDTKRSTRESIDQIVEGMKWLGLDADEGPFFQMERLDRYRDLAQQLLDSGKAYRCYCSRDDLARMREEQKANGLKPRYDGRCRERGTPIPEGESVVRFMNPSRGQVKVRDRIRGEVTFENAELDDLIILRSDGVPTYNFSVVIDDNDMGITHVVRGDDHLNNTPRQLNIMEALGLSPPEYAHLPMILGADGSRLSKRHGAASVLAYRDAGYLPHAVLNYIVRLGWSHGDQELFFIEELIELFGLDGVNESAASFDPDKFLWVNQQWLKQAATESIAISIKPLLEARYFDLDGGPAIDDIVEVQRDRAHTLEEMVDKSAFIYCDPKTYAPKAVKKYFKSGVLPILESLAGEFNGLTDWDITTTQTAVENVAEKLELNMGKVAQPLRVAVTGESASPGIGQTLFLLGREKTLDRLRRAVEFVKDGTTP